MSLEIDRKGESMDCKICKSQEEMNHEIGKFTHWILRDSFSEKGLKGYITIESRKHYENWEDLSDEAFVEYGPALKFALETIQKNHKPRKIYSVSIAEAVPHLHIHLIPNYEGDARGIEYIAKAITGDLRSKN